MFMSILLDTSVGLGVIEHPTTSYGPPYLNAQCKKVEPGAREGLVLLRGFTGSDDEELDIGLGRRKAHADNEFSIST